MEMVKSSMRVLSKEQQKFIINNCKKMDNFELAEAINRQWGTDYNNVDIGYKKKYIKKKLGVDTDCPKELNKSIIKKGHVPFNKGLKWDDYMSKENQAKCREILNYTKCGKETYNAQPIGTERLKLKDNGKKYWYVKTGRDKWEAKHRMIWEQANGPIPKDKMLLFLDGNPENLSLENLVLISKQEGLYLNRHDLINEEPELTKAGINLAKIDRLVRNKERK